MAFVRSFPKEKMAIMSNQPLFVKLYNDVKDGVVFPAIRKDELHFYHGGGCLFKFSGNSFKRNRAYDGGKDGYVAEMAYGKSFTDGYEDFKLKNKERFQNKKQTALERQFLDALNPYTYKGQHFPEICVLDIEVRVNEDNSRKKCDMVLLNSVTHEIMFVEGKLFSDERMSCGLNDRTPEVVSQVTQYTKLIQSCPDAIEAQYSEYISIMSKLIFKSEIKIMPRLIRTAKLLVYETPTDEEIMKLNRNTQIARMNVRSKIKEAGIDALWVDKGKSDDSRYSLVNIWDALSK